MGFFKIKAKTRLQDMEIGASIAESDFASITPDGTFVQLEYVEEESKARPYIVKPGTWTIQKTGEGMKLEPTTFVNDKILEAFVHTTNITDKIDCFFNKLHVYKELGFDVPKRAALLYGPAGSGKSTATSKACRKYQADGKTAVISWATDKIDPFEVKDFFRCFEYKGVDKVILIMEDVGGVEMEQVRIKSTSSLLALLDNQEKTFTIPIFILATTNFPEALLGNLANRPGRFDDKIEMGYPKPEARAELLKFFLKGNASEEAISMILGKKCEEFSPAHIKEVVVRSAIYDISLEDAIAQITKEIEVFKQAFVSNKPKFGLGDGYND
jgi:hypothetical protein